MFKISAFADEISPNPEEQVAVLSAAGVRHIELRSIHKTNVLDLTDMQVNEFKSLLERNGFTLSAIGSPIGKVKIDQPFGPHLQRFRRAVELCKVFGTPNIRVFSYYPPGEAHDWNGVAADWEKQVFDRMAEKVRIAEQNGVRLVHENEHRIYGDSPERVVKLFTAVKSPAFKAVYDAANYVFAATTRGRAGATPRRRRPTSRTGRPVRTEQLGRRGRGPLARGHRRGGEGRLTASLPWSRTCSAADRPAATPRPELFPKAIEAFRAIVTRAGGSTSDRNAVSTRVAAGTPVGQRKPSH
ncbi:MAG: TIM barrel protein [Gemmataceae bacterium]